MTITRQYTGYQELEDELQEIARRRAEERKRFQDAIALAESLKTELAARDEEVSRLDEVNRQDRQALAQTIEARDHALALAEQQTELAERAAAARLRAENERQRAEDERQRAEAQRQRTEDELQRTADERQRAEEERQRVADGIRRAVERRLLAVGDRLPVDVRTRIAAMSDPLEALEALEGWLERLLNEATESAVRRDGAH